MEETAPMQRPGGRAGPLAVGLIGLGYWGPNLLRVMTDREDVRVDWICDLRGERLDQFSRRFPSVEATTRAEDLFEAPDLDAILIATPVFSHFELASASLEAGKHTFVEKPLASSSGEAEELLELATQRRVALMCGHTFVYSPAVRAVKGLLERGELGE